MSKVVGIIIGLGNHGTISGLHVKSRHSIGMLACNALALQYDTQWKYERKFKAYTSYLEFNKDRILLMKSKFSMNINGKSLIRAVKEFDVDHSNILVLHDDLDRKLGKLSWKRSGSAGGHNGVRSVISYLKTDEFSRLRIGIGRPRNKRLVTQYVLNDFTEIEVPTVKNCIIESLHEIKKNVFADYLIEPDNTEVIEEAID